MAVYDLTPVDVPKVETKYRSIKTKLPVPESLPIFAALQHSEPGTGARRFARRCAK